MNKITECAHILIALFLAAATSALAQTERNAEQLRKQIEDLKGRGANSTFWSPAVKSAYDQSLNELYAAYEKAIGGEIRQLNDLLEVVTEQSARKPLEDQISRLRAFGRQTPVTNNASQPANAGANGGNGQGANSNQGSPNKDKFKLTIYVRVKGTGYPISYAHAQLLKLKADAEQPEYHPYDGQGVTCLDDKKRCNTDLEKPLEMEIDVADTPATYKIAVTKDLYHPFVMEDVIVPTKGGSATINVELTPRDDKFYRLILGIEQTGVSAGNSQQNIFLNMFTSYPLLNRPFYTECTRGGAKTGRAEGDEDNCRPPRHRIWGDIRVTSVPQPKQNLFQALNGSFGGVANEGIGQLNDLDAGFSFLAGYQFRVTQGAIAGNRFDFSLIAGGGASAVLSPEKNGQIYKIPDSKDTERRRRLEERLRNEAAFDPSKIGDYTSIAFVTQERDRFLRSYYGGFRFETHYGDINPTRPSGMFDLLVGQDEAVTGGRLRSAVLRLDGFFPLPLGKGGLVYLFGTAQMGLKRSKTSDPLLLPLADTTQTLTSPETLVVPVPAANRDLYRIGVGVNLSRVFSGNRNE